MDNFTFYSPTQFVFGKDTGNETGKLIKKHNANNVLIVYGGGFVVRSGRHYAEKVAQFATRIWNIPIQDNHKEMAFADTNALKEFFVSLGLPVTFKQLVIENPDVDLLVTKLHNDKGENIGNYVRLGRKETKEIYELAKE